VDRLRFAKIETDNIGKLAQQFVVTQQRFARRSFEMTAKALAVRRRTQEPLRLSMSGIFARRACSKISSETKRSGSTSRNRLKRFSEWVCCSIASYQKFSSCVG
jgi:hypothetical protein